MKQSIGILGLGVYLPPQVRKNDWWPPEIVEKWRKKAKRAAGHRGAEDLTTKTEGERLVYAALAELDGDPFKGARERRIAGENMSAADLEVFAAQEALRDANLPASSIDLLLTYSAVPDHLATNHACTVHHRLGIPQRCFTLSVEAVCNSFLMQLTLAQRLIQAGEARFALLTQSSLLSRIVPPAESYSTWFGDGATAVVVGPVRDGRGVLGRSHRTDGSLQNTLVAGIPGKKWFDEGRVYLYSENLVGAHRMFETVADYGRQVASEALTEAGLRTTDVDFYAAHQGTAWLPHVTQQHLGVSHARSLDTFSSTGSLFAANIPLVLSVGRERHLMKDDDIVLMYAGGSGITWSSLVLRWGGA